MGLLEVEPVVIEDFRILSVDWSPPPEWGVKLSIKYWLKLTLNKAGTITGPFYIDGIGPPTASGPMDEPYVIPSEEVPFTAEVVEWVLFYESLAFNPLGHALELRISLDEYVTSAKRWFIGLLEASVDIALAGAAIGALYYYLKGVK